MLDLKQEEEDFKLNKELMYLEKKNFNSINDSYKIGQASFLDLTASLDNLTNAKDAYYRNFYSFKKTIAEYYFHKGTLYEKINTH